MCAAINDSTVDVSKKGAALAAAAWGGLLVADRQQLFPAAGHHPQ